MGINESPDRFIGKPTIQKTTASPFGRLGLCALTIWAAEYFARTGERSTIALKAELARWTLKGEHFYRDAKGSDGNDETHDEEDSAGRARSCIVRGACMHHGGMRRWRR